MLGRLRNWLSGTPEQRLTRLLGDQPLPVMRQTAMQALTNLRNPALSLPQIGEMLAADPGLSLTILRHANSAGSGLRRQVSDVRHALTLLGRTTLEAVIVAEMVREAVPRTAVRGFDPSQFWAAANRRSTLARELARIVDPPNTMIAGTAALLEDVAIPLLAHGQKDLYGPVLARWNDDGGDLSKAEQDSFGWDHSMVGRWLCEAWDLPPDLTNLIATHHSTENGFAPVVLVSGLGDKPDDEDLDRIIELARSSFGTSPEVIATAFERAKNAA